MTNQVRSTDAARVVGDKSREDNKTPPPTPGTETPDYARYREIAERAIADSRGPRSHIAERFSGADVIRLLDRIAELEGATPKVFAETAGLVEAIGRLNDLVARSDRSMGVNPAVRQTRADIGVILDALTSKDEEIARLKDVGKRLLEGEEGWIRHDEKVFARLHQAEFVLGVMAACAENARQLWQAHWEREHDRAQSAEARALSLEGQVEGLKRALERIERWFGEFPETGDFWDDGSPVSYSAQYGSNGERDFMRSIARAALASLPQGDQGSSVAGVQAAPGGATEEPRSAGSVLPLLASDHIYHTEECATWDGSGSGDERCSCGAVEVLVQLETVYALLWATQTSDTKVHAARKRLLRLIGKEGQRRAIEALPAWAKPTSPTSEMLAPDPAKSNAGQPSEASASIPATDEHPSPPQTPVSGDGR